jgi:hypothetical protein
VAEQLPLLAGYALASIQGLMASGPRARRLRSAASVVDAAKPRCARLEGFSLHANVAVPAPARERLEHVCRYLLRPPLALERLSEKLCVLVPAPRTHLRRYHGVLAPPAAWRSLMFRAPRRAPAKSGVLAWPARPLCR